MVAWDKGVVTHEVHHFDGGQSAKEVVDVHAVDGIAPIQEEDLIRTIEPPNLVHQCCQAHPATLYLFRFRGQVGLQAGVYVVVVQNHQLRSPQGQADC